MSTRTFAHHIVGLSLLIVILAGCNAQPTATSMPESPSATATSTPIPPTSTPKPPTATPTSIPVVATYPLVPRYMLPSAPYVSTEILGATCHYQQDNWNTRAAYIAYACPDLNVVWLSIQFTDLEAGQSAEDFFGELPVEEAVSIPPGELLSKFGDVVIFGRLVNGQSDKSKYAYFMIYETESYVISVDTFFPEDTMTSLEEFYQGNGEVVHHAVLELMLEKVESESTRLAPTPMAVDQQELYDQIAPWLVTEAEANEFYQGAADMFGDPFDGTWVWLGDEVDARWKSVCRKFADRTNEDAPLVAFGNCIYIRPDYNLDSLQESFQNAVVLESTFEYPDQSIIYGGKMPNGHTSLNAYILQGDYLFYVWINSRTLGGQKTENVFRGFDDGFIYKVMMTNLDHYTLEASDDIGSQEGSDSNDPFVGTWISTDPGDGSNQQLVISKNDDIYDVNYEDDVASSCGFDNFGKTIAATGTGSGIANGNVLGVDFSIYCLTNPQSFLATVHVDYTYNETANTIKDGSTTWRRP